MGSGYKCRHYIALLLFLVGLSFAAIESISPFYFDQIVKLEGLKLAGKFGAAFEIVEGSSYLRPNQTK